MPLVALAVFAYACGLAAGLHGMLVAGACVVCALLLLSIVKHTPHLVALAVLGGSGILFGRAAERSDHACASAALAQQHFTARLLADAAPCGARAEQAARR